VQPRATTTSRLADRRSTPAMLSLLRGITISLAMVFASVAAFGVNRRAHAIDDVRTAARQLLALQDVQVRVVHADAIASASYLVGGQEDAKQRTEYLDEIGKAGDGLVAVSADASAADIVQLSEASRLLGGYAGLVEQARANNRQGFPVGAAYQRQANDIVTNSDPAVADIVSSLRLVEDSQRGQINGKLGTAHRAGVWLHLFGWLLLAALAAGSLWLARRFRRVVNVPIAIAGAVVFLLLLIGGAAQSTAVNDADGAVSRPLTSADEAAQARAAAFEARSQEALTLINRGNGAANETKWKLADATVGAALTALGSSTRLGAADAAPPYGQYAAAHSEIRRLDDAGKWDEAVKLSLGTEHTATSIDAVQSFADFDRVVGQRVSNDGAQASASLASAADPLTILQVLAFVVGIAVAVLVAIGYGRRLKEYR
jgi:hypothetical protein